MLQEKYTLSNGLQIPKLGLGTWFINNKNVVNAVKEAIALGYRNIDTAQAYMNEEGVGEGIRLSKIAREELFVTSKVGAQHKTYEAAKKSIDDTLAKMNIEYLDMMIIHAPQPWGKFRKSERFFSENKQVWKALEDAYKEGKLKAIGVSNFLQDDLENILEDCEIKPMVNQILVHIGNTPSNLIDFCQKNDIVVEAYSPIAHGRAMKSKQIKTIAEKYEVSIPQLCIRYVIQLGTVALPKTANKEHMKSNADLNFEIGEADMLKLKKMKPLGYGLLKLFPVYRGN